MIDLILQCKRYLLLFSERLTALKLAVFTTRRNLHHSNHPPASPNELPPSGFD